MNEIIKVNYDSEQPTVSARDLYDSLSSEDGAKGTERFSKWFERYCGYGFTEGEDYSNPYQKVRVQKEGNREVQREVEDYDLSVDMAKQICMLQKTERGKQIRQYLIDLDKAWNTPEQVMARALKMADKTIDKLKTDNAALLEDVSRMKPKEVFADAVSTSKASILVGELAKILKQNGYETGEKRLFAQLREEKYLISRKGTDYNMPTQKSMELGLFEIKETAITHADGHTTVSKTTKVTGKGQQYFINKFLAKDEKSA